MKRLKPAKRKPIMNQSMDQKVVNEKSSLGKISAKDQVIIICLVVIIAILSCLILYRISHLEDKDKITDQEKVENILLTYAKDIYKEDTVYVQKEGESLEIHLDLEGMRDYYKKDVSQLIDYYGCDAKDTYIVVLAKWMHNDYRAHLKCSKLEKEK